MIWDAIGWIFSNFLLFLGLIIGGVILWVIIAVKMSLKKDEEKKKMLIEKYGKEDGERLAEGEMWIGMTSEQVLDALGQPDMVDQKQLVKCSREVFKWRVEGKRRIAYQITCDDGIVTAISDKR